MFGLVYVAIGLLGLYLALYLRTEKKKGKVLPGPKGWPLIGSIADMVSDKLLFKLSAYTQQFGDIFLLKVFGDQIVVLNSAELIRKAFCADPYKKLMNDRASTYFGERVLHGNHGIVFSQHAYEPIHSGLRKGFTKSLHMFGDGKKRFENLMQEELGHLVKEVESYQGREFEFQELTTRFIQNIISVLLRGQRIQNENEYRAFGEFVKEATFLLSPGAEALMKAVPFLGTVPNTYRDHYERIESAKAFLIRAFVEEAKATYKDGEIRGYIDYMIKENLQSRESQQPDEEMVYSDTRIIAATLETLGTGVGTTLSHLSSTFLLLMNYPEYQEKIQAEIDRVIGRDRLPTFEDKAFCPMVEAVALETHRYHPVVPSLIPHVCRSDTEFEGYHIAKGSILFPNIFHTHYDEKIWGDPWTFRPERFLDDSGAIIPNDHPLRKSWLAFGTGRRQCVGESLARSRVFLFVTTLLQRWSFQLPQGIAISSDLRDGDVEFSLVNTRPKLFKCIAVPRQTVTEA